MANRRFIDFPIAASVGNNDIVLIWQDGVNKQTTKATLFAGSPNSLAGLTDVDISALANGQILQYNSTTSKWENIDRTDIDLDQLGDVTIVSPTNGQVLVYNSSTSKWENSSAGFVPYTGAVTTVNLGAQSILAGSFVKAGGTSAQFLKADGSVDSTAYGTGSVTSVALTMPSAFSVANSPITTAGTLAVTGAGTVAQYVRGDGSLADFPATTGGGASVSYYLNGSVSQGTIGGVAYREFNRNPVFGAGTDISISSDGYIASFITDAGDPNKLLIPAGNWNLETYFSASTGGGSPTFYVELYKYDGSTFTLIASSATSPELIAFGTNLNPYFSTLAVPQTTLALTDRLALRYYVNTSGRTITLHTENDHLCQVITTFTTGLTALNGLTTQVQFFAVGTSGTDFNIASATDTHTFNLPTASGTNRGALSSADWALFTQAYNDKINSASVTGTTTKTLTLTQQDGGTITASWTDLNTDAVISVFGRTGAVVAANGDYTTAQVTESGNLYFTNARSRQAISLTTSGTSGAATYDNSTGVFNIPNYGSALSGYLPLTGGTLTGPLGGTSISLSGDITANRYRGVNSLVLNSYTTVNPSSNVYLYSPLNDRDAWIYLDSADASSNWGIYHRQIDSAVSGLPANSIGFIGGGASGLQAWISLANGNGFFAGSLTASNLSGTNTGNVTIGTANGLSLSGQALSLGLASGSANGALSSTDWTTFNSKQNALTNPVTGTGSAGQVAYWSSSSAITGESNLFWDSTNDRLGIGIAVPTNPLHIVSNTLSQLNIQASSGNTNAQINLEPTGTGIALIGPANAVALAFRTDATQRLAIFSNGNVTIANSPSDAGFKLDVNGTGRFSGQLTASNNITAAGIIYGRTTNNFPSSGLGYYAIRTNNFDGERGGITLQVSSSTNTLTDALTINYLGAATFSSSVTATKTAKNTYGIQIAGAFYGAPRLQVYDLAADPNGYMGLGTDMSGAPYELSNYFPRTAGLGRWSVGSWAGDFGTGQYVSGYNEKLFITESAAQFNVSTTFSNDLTVLGFSGLREVSGLYFSPNGTTVPSIAMYRAGVDAIGFSTNTTRRLIIDGNGNVGINTATAATRFHLESASVSYGQLRFLNTSSSGETSINIGRTNQTLEQRWTIGQGVAGIGDSFGFYTGGSSRVNFTTSGNVLIGTQTTIGPAAGRIDLLYSGLVQYGMNIRSSHTDGIAISFVNSSGTQVGTIYQNSSSTAYNTSSDYRLKTDLKDFNGVEIINKIKTYDFEWKTDNTRSYGVIAHELKEVIDYAVYGEKDSVTMQGVDYSKLVPIMVKAIQEQQQEITELKNKLS